MAVSALIPHPAVVTATIGTCSIQKREESINGKVALRQIQVKSTTDMQKQHPDTHKIKHID